MATVGIKVKQVRNYKGLTQKQFAEVIGVSRSYLVNIEQGSTAPTDVFVNCLCLTYNIDKDWILSNSDTPIVLKKGLSTEGDSINSEIILEKYKQLEPPYQDFFLLQIKQLIDLQKDVGDMIFKDNLS